MFERGTISEVLEDPEVSTARVEDVGRDDPVQVPDPKKEPAEFKEKETKDPQEAVEILFGEALPALPFMTEKEVLEQYQPLRYRTGEGGSKKLLKGSASRLGKTVLTSVEREIRDRSAGSGAFVGILVFLASDKKSAQINVMFQNFHLVTAVIWSTADAVYACGNEHFGLSAR
jgi:hypothetical protein